MSGLELHCPGTRIRQCSSCETPLPLCDAVNPEDVRIWLCSQCGTEFRAMLAPDYSLDELRGVCPEPVIFDPTSIQPVAPEMLAFAERLNAPIDTKLEKRAATRHPFIATLRAMEFDKRLRPVGSPFNTLCRNLSTCGICLINGREVRSEFLVIELLTAAGGIPIQTLAHVLRQRPVGPYHDIGFEFVTKLAKPKSEML